MVPLDTISKWIAAIRSSGRYVQSVFIILQTREYWWRFIINGALSKMAILARLGNIIVFFGGGWIALYFWCWRMFYISLSAFIPLVCSVTNTRYIFSLIRPTAVSSNSNTAQPSAHWNIWAAVTGIEVDEARRPHTCSRPWEFEEKKRKKNESRRTQNTPWNLQQPGDRDHLETACSETRPKR